MNNRSRETTVSMVFNYMGKEVKAILNLADGFANALTIEEGCTIEDFPRIEKYLKDEGFFDFYDIQLYEQ